MKKIISLFILFLIVSVSCSQIDIIDTRSATKDVTISVNNSLINRYARARSASCISTKNSQDAFSVKPYLNANGDTVMYIINYSDGWEVIAADKRVPSTIAKSSTGRLSIENNPSLKVWFDVLSDDMTRIMEASTQELAFDAQEIEKNISFWDGIDFPADSIADNISEGRYVLYSIETEDIQYDERKHILNTHWHAANPYNDCLPWMDHFQNSHIWASSETIATAQLMYFLHYEIGVPSEMVSESQYIGVLPNDSTTLQGNWRSDVWQQMGTPVDTSGKVAVMVAYISNLLGGGNQGHTISGIRNALSLSGIHSELSEYDTDIVKSSLLNGMPLLASAKAHDGKRVSFIIDGYVRTRQVSTYTYKWATKQTVNNEYLFDDSSHPDITNIYFGSPSILRIYMNWGLFSQWKDNYDNSGMYSLIDGWLVKYPTGAVSIYDRNKQLLYGFSENE